MKSLRDEICLAADENDVTHFVRNDVTHFVRNDVTHSVRNDVTHSVRNDAAPDGRNDVMLAHCAEGTTSLTQDTSRLKSNMIECRAAQFAFQLP